MADPDNQKSYTGIGLMTGSKVGGYCWIDFDGEEVGPDGEYLKHAVGDFMHVFKRPKFDLPPAPTNISGREGRSRMLFRVPPAEGALRQIGPSAGPTGAIEWLGRRSTEKCGHAVIEGQHPGGNGWFSGGEEGNSPEDDIADCPDLPEWMISAIITWPPEGNAEIGGEATKPSWWTDKPGPIDVLTPSQTKKTAEGDVRSFSPTEAHRLASSAATTTCCGLLTLSLVARHRRSEAVRDVAAGLGRQVRLV